VSTLYKYSAVTERGEDPDVVVVSFPDVPEAVTQGRGLAEALREAADALGTALLTYPMRRLPLPAPETDGGHPVAVPAEIAAKLAVLDAFAAAGITQAELGRRLGKDEKEGRRILDPMHATKLATLSAARGALGRRLVISVEEQPAAA
jgi:antitoxin HicB